MYGAKTVALLNSTPMPISAATIPVKTSPEPAVAIPLLPDRLMKVSCSVVITVLASFKIQLMLYL